MKTPTAIAEAGELFVQRAGERGAGERGTSELLASFRRSGRDSGLTHVSEHLATLGLAPSARAVSRAVPVGGDGAPALPASRAWTGDSGPVQADPPRSLSVPQHLIEED